MGDAAWNNTVENSEQPKLSAANEIMTAEYGKWTAAAEMKVT